MASPFASIQCFTPDTPELWGASRSLLLLIEAWTARGVPLRVCSYTPGALFKHLSGRGVPADFTLRTEEHQWIRTRSTPIRLFRIALETALGVFRARRLLRQHRPAVLYANTLMNGTALAAGLLTGQPVVVHMREVPRIVRANDPVNRLRKAVLRRSRARFIANSDASAATLREMGIPDRAITVIHNGVDTAEFHPGAFDRAAARRELGIQPDEFLVVSVGRPTPDKGADIFLQAAARVVAQVPHARFILAGGPIDTPFVRDQLLPLRRELGMEATFQLAGIVPDTRVYLAAADVVAVASREETFGRVNIEAMAMARPVVAPAVGGIPEVLADGETGLLTTPKDPASLAEKLLVLAADPALRLRMGVAGERRVATKFSLAVYAEAVLRVLQDVAADAPGARP